MLLSTETGGLRIKFDDKTAIKMIKDAGFDAFDYSFCYMLDQPEKDSLGENYIEKAYELRKYTNSIGIECNQAHAPLDFRHTDSVSLDDMKYLRNVRAIEAATVLGAKSIVIHPLGSILRSDDHNLDYFEYNTMYLRSYIPYCEKYKMHISVENLNTSKDGKAMGIPGLTTPDEISAWVKSLGSDWFNICLDTGHSAITGIEPEDMIRGIGGTMIKALHIHDNDRLGDLHLLPFEGKLNWDNIAQALKDIDYEGDFTLEATHFFTGVPDKLVPVSLRYAAETGRYIMNRIKG